MTTTIWVYEYNHFSDNETGVHLFASEQDAQKYACESIKSTLIFNFNANELDSEYYHFYIEITDLIYDKSYNKVISNYNDWVGEMDYEEQAYHNVYSRELNQSWPPGTAKSSSASVSKKVQFANGATCKCGYHNEYVSESNQDDGTYKCGTCKALGGVFG